MKKIVLRNLKNIHVISQNSDVVPLLWYFDLLITDNSSINYDFLKTRKQTIFLDHLNTMCVPIIV